MINRFVLNEVSYFGPGAREVLPQEIKRLGLHKAFVATDKDLIKFGVADKVLKVLENAGIPYEIFSEIKPNPTVSNVKAGVEAFAKSGADFILAIGGGMNMQAMMKQAQKMQESMLKAQEEIALMESTGTAGGGMVTATVTGTSTLKSIEIKPDVVDPDDIDMLQDLVVAAVNEALKAASDKSQSQMSAITGGIGGGLGGLL